MECVCGQSQEKKIANDTLAIINKKKKIGVLFSEPQKIIG